MNLLKSPGVQITEKDLSLRINVPTGTVITVPGFASQGPIAEPILVTSSSELESIFGTPTNAAERYFHHSCREILNSPAQLLAIRLPYGKDLGTAYDSNMYSGLFYPMASAWNAELQVDEWVVGQPQFRPLNKQDYESLLHGDFAWTSTSTSPTYKFAKLGDDGTPEKDNNGNVIYKTNVPNDEIEEYVQVVDTTGSAFGMPTDGSETTKEVSAGFFILNDLQTVINEISEGFYIGLADNSSVFVDSPNYDSIKEITTIKDNSIGSSYFTLPTTRLDFALSATQGDSLAGVTSVSENLEKVGFVGFGTNLYQDHLSLGVFRVRRSTVDPTKLALGAAERYLGSLDAARKQVNPSGGAPVNAFIQDIVSEGSPSIKLVINPVISRNFDWTVGGTAPTCRVTVSNEAKKLFPIGIFSADTRNIEKTKVVGNIPLKLDKALRVIENPETIELDVIIDAGLSTIFASTYTAQNAGDIAFDDGKYVNPDAIYDESWKCVTLPLVNFAENTRKDCMAIIDLPRHYFVKGANQKILDIEGNDFTSNISKPLKAIVAYNESNYVATYGNWIKINDPYSSKRYWHPSSSFAAAIFARSDAVSQPWYAPAGLNRGLFNALDIAFNPNQKQRDVLYEMSVNPIVFFNGDGHAIMGQKTLQFKPTAFDRINVRRLFLALERQVQKTLKYFVFEPNTQITRTRLMNTIKPLFEYAKAQQGVYDFLIVCDDRNNTPDSIDRNELIVDIYLKPVRAAEFILVNFIATRTGQDFAELI